MMKMLALILCSTKFDRKLTCALIINGDEFFSSFVSIYLSSRLFFFYASCALLNIFSLVGYPLVGSSQGLASFLLLFYR